MKKFLNLLIILIIFLFSATQVQAKDIKFIQVTDIHFNSSETSIENLDDLIERINETPKLDFVVITGDNIDSAKKDVLVDLLKRLKLIKKPYYIQIGNHDCFKAAGLSKEQYAELVRKYNKNQHNKTFNFVVKKGDINLVFVDGAKEVFPANNGYYKNETIAWLEKTLDKYDKKNIIIFQHFPLIEQKPMSGHNAFRTDQYQRVLSEHNNVKAILAGHYHLDREVYLNGVYHLMTHEAHGQFASYREVYLRDMGNHKYESYSQVVRYAK